MPLSQKTNISNNHMLTKKYVKTIVNRSLHSPNKIYKVPFLKVGATLVNDLALH